MNMHAEVNTILDEQQKNRVFQDAGDRVAGSRKETALIKKLLNPEELKEADDNIAIAALKRDRIIAVPTPEELKEQGNTSGAALLKTRLFQSLPSKAPKWIKDAGEAARYTERIQEWGQELEAAKTLEDVKKTVYQTNDYADNKLLGPRFFNLTHRRSDPARATWTKAVMAEAYTAEAAEKEYNNYLARWPQMNAAYIKSHPDAQPMSAERYCTHEHSIREEDWSWVDEKNKRTRSGKPREPGLHARKPLDYIVRTGGEVMPDDLRAPHLQTIAGYQTVQFGKYVDDAWAEAHVRHTAGAIADMTRALDFNMPAFHRESGVSMAFGARGIPGAMAHYECAHNIINLTKTNGDGSIAHEEMHAIDAYLSQVTEGQVMHTGRRGSGVRRDFLSDETKFQHRITEQDDPIRRAMTKVMLNLYYTGDPDEIYQAFTGNRREDYQQARHIARHQVSPFYQVAEEKRREKGGYWSRPHEVLARGSEAYLIHELESKGMENNYLVAPTKGDCERYPQDAHREQIVQPFRDLFSAIGDTLPPLELKPLPQTEAHDASKQTRHYDPDDCQQLSLF